MTKFGQSSMGASVPLTVVGPKLITSTITQFPLVYQLGKAIRVSIYITQIIVDEKNLR